MGLFRAPQREKPLNFLVLSGLIMLAIILTGLTPARLFPGTVAGEETVIEPIPGGAGEIYTVDRFEGNLAVLIPDRPGDPFLVDRSEIAEAREGDVILLTREEDDKLSFRIMPELTRARRKLVRQLLGNLTAD